MDRTLRQLNFMAVTLAGIVLPLLRPWGLIIFGAAGTTLSLAIMGANPTTLVVATLFVGVTLVGLWWEWRNRRSGSPTPAILSARIVDDQETEDAAD